MTYWRMTLYAKKALQLFLGMAGLCIWVPALCFGVLAVNDWYYDYRSLDCAPLINDPITTLPLDTTDIMIRGWADNHFTQTNRWDYQDWSRSSGEQVVLWHGDGNEHRAFFDSTGKNFQHIQRDYGQGEALSGHQVLSCFGEPDFYQAYYAPEPHHTALIMEFIYPEQGLILYSYDLSGIWGTPQANEHVNFREIRYFAPNQSLIEIAPILTGHPRNDEWDNREEWVNANVHPWQGWEQVQIRGY